MPLALAGPLLREPVRVAPAGKAVEGLELSDERQGGTAIRLDTSDRIEEFIAGVADSGLTGRGGGHFPVADKWRSARAAGAGGIVVGNGCESEPLSAKDVTLLLTRPSMVIEGIRLVAEVVGARAAFLRIHDDQPAALAVIHHAIARDQREHSGAPAIQLSCGPARYVAGEASAVVRAVTGGPDLQALPAFHPAPLAAGTGGPPALVHNVETLARIALLARASSNGLRRLIASSSLVTVATRAERTVLEVDGGTSVRDVLEAVADGKRAAEPAAVLVGGYGGRWARGQDLAGVGLSEKSLSVQGLSLGAGVLRPLRPGECGLVVTAGIACYLADQSARQCGPCLFGLRSLADAMATLAFDGGSRRDRRRIAVFLSEIAGRGACHHPDGAVALVASALEVFAEEVERHRRSGPCEAGRRP